MRLALILDWADIRRWHCHLAQALRRDGHSVAIVGRAAPPCEAKTRQGLERICAMERRVGLMPADHPTAPAAAADIAALQQPAPQGAVDCTIDLVDGGATGPSIAPLFEGSRGMAALAARVAAGEAPSVGIAYRESERAADICVARGRPVFKDRVTLARALDQVALAVQRLTLQTVRRIARGEPMSEIADEPGVSAAGRIGAARFALTALAMRSARRLARLAARMDHWRIGWRWADGDRVRDRLAWPDAGYAFLEDDGKRYFADPFVFMHDGVAHVFCEEFPYATQKGIISHFTLSRDGKASVPRPVLERPCHLSYPFVFAEDGAIWMIPESSAARTVELYRAERFPDVWVRHAVLIEDVAAVDATLVTHAGRRWMFAGIVDDGGSSWDSLGLFHAPSLTGPWTPHPLNPVVIDVRAARPAGAMFVHEGRLFRPAQDCSRDYGSALTLCEVTRLDPDGYAQRIVRHLAAPPAWGAQGVHTLNDANGLEVIDCVGWRRRF